MSIHLRRHFLVLCCLILLLSQFSGQQLGKASAAGESPLSTSSGGNQGNYSTTGSWAIGIVVPQNSPTSDGKVEWQNVKNVTALFRVPNITNTDNTIFVVLSLMTSNGAIIQIASGIYENMSSWGTYGMDIIHPASYPQQYTPSLDTAEPGVTPGQTASLSLYVSNNTWYQKLVDLNSSQSVSAPFESTNLSPSLKIGDQFVIALESYTTSNTVFQNMGNITLESILVDGARVQSGAYAYSGWDNVHYPLFSVGGATPPNFISVNILGNGSAVWSYNSGWSSGSSGIPIDFTVVYLVFGAVAALAISLITLLLIQRKKNAVRLR